MVMIFDHDRTIEKDIQEVLDFINPFYQTFYDSNCELNCRTMFRNKSVILLSSHNYAKYHFVIYYENEYREKYSVNFKFKELIYNSGFEGQITGGFVPHSRHLNFPQYYSNSFKWKNDIHKSYFYYGIDMNNVDLDHYFKEFGVDPANMTETEFFTFALNYNLMERMK